MHKKITFRSMVNNSSKLSYLAMTNKLNQNEMIYHNAY